MRVAQALGQSVALDVEDLLAARVAHGRIGRHEGGGVRRPLRFAALRGEFALAEGIFARGCGGAEGRGAPAFGVDLPDVDLRGQQLLLQRKALARRQRLALIGDQDVAGEDQIGRRLAEARSRVEIAGPQPGGLLEDQHAQIVVLAHLLGRCREVDDQLRSGQRQVSRRSGGDPEVLADLDAALHAVDLQHQIDAEGHLLTAERQAVAAYVGTRCEPARLVEFGVVGDVALRHDRQNLPLGEGHGAVVERGARSDGHAHHNGDGAVGRGGHQFAERLFGSLQQQGLAEQIAAGVSRQREFGKDDELRPFVRSPAHERLDALAVVTAVGHPHRGDGPCHLHVSETVHRAPICSTVRPGSGSPARPGAWS